MQFILERNSASTIQIQQLTADIAGLKEVARQHTADLAVHAELADAQKSTQESLNILTRVVQEIIPRLPKG
ncbi:MAG TPA: hypothetical protein VMH81_08530 [Bryobacteraceae bacterium]|nr:hypothetical protein [Bryobacteraceae bacterium]